MSVADILINIVIWLLQNSLLKMPTSIEALPLATLQTNLTSFTSTMANSFNFINYFLPVGLLFSLFGAIIFAEISLHLGWKGIKFIINVFRGSGA
jgi:hypothetical protein